MGQYVQQSFKLYRMRIRLPNLLLKSPLHPTSQAVTRFSRTGLGVKWKGLLTLDLAVFLNLSLIEVFSLLLGSKFSLIAPNISKFSSVYLAEIIINPGKTVKLPV